MIKINQKIIYFQSLSPGVVQTDFFHAGKFLPEDIRMKDHAPTLDPSDISNVILYLLQLPYHVNITEVTVRPVLEAF
jgi:NADP-dependent 3-hydroxy acid dehydrogenase YdfG